jgi:hypothetical protein
MSEETFLTALFLGCGTIVAVSSLLFINRLLERRHERTLKAPAPVDADRLDRMERAIDATALEVERVSEASRYLVKLLSSRAERPALPRVERVITPH